MSRHRKHLRCVPAIVATLTLVAACGGGGSGQNDGGGDTLRVGAVQPLSGPLSALGKYSLDGMEMAVEFINEEGGVDGKKVELVVADAPTVQDTSTQVRRLVRQERVKVVAGTYGSSQAISAATTTTRFGGFYFEINSASADITTESAPYSLKVPWTIPDLVQKTPEFLTGTLARELNKSPGDLRVALIHEDGAYGSGVSKLLPDGLRKAGVAPLVSSDAYTAGSVQDFTPIINRLKRSQPDVLLAASYLDDAQLFIRQAQQQGLRVPAIVGLTAGFSDFALPSKVPADALDGIYVIDSNPMLETGLSEEGKRLREEMLSRYAERGEGDPVSHTAYAFVGMYILLHHILPGVDVSDREAILEKGMNLDVPLGDLPMGFGVKFGAEDDPVHPHINERTVVLLNQWQDGKLISIGPDKYREAEPIDRLTG